MGAKPASPRQLGTQEWLLAEGVMAVVFCSQLWLTQLPPCQRGAGLLAANRIAPHFAPGTPHFLPRSPEDGNGGEARFASAIGDAGVVAGKGYKMAMVFLSAILVGPIATLLTWG